VRDSLGGGLAAELCRLEGEDANLLVLHSVLLYKRANLPVDTSVTLALFSVW
jgi:hypothetical protein